MYRLSPSKIDNFRIYKDEVFDMSKEQLIERLTGVQERTEAMILGSDVHKFIETGNVAGLMTDEIEYPYLTVKNGLIKQKRNGLPLIYSRVLIH